jgi:hypothetical protein
MWFSYQYQEFFQMNKGAANYGTCSQFRKKKLGDFVSFSIQAG